jgi:ketosteroid isomerase-like protein
MSKENLEVVKKLFEAVERRDLAGVLAAYDENVVIREAESLPYGGVYRGLDGARQHAYGYVRNWGNLQNADAQKMAAEFLDAGEYVVVLWRQKALKDERNLDLSAASVYKLRNGKVIESEMFHDTAAVLKFLQSE